MAQSASSRIKGYITELKDIKRIRKDRTLWGYDLNALAVVGMSSLVFILERYYPIKASFPSITQLTYFLLIPLAAGFLFFGDKPQDYGIRIGNWRLGIVLTTVTLAVFSLIVYGASKMPEFYSYYHKSSLNWPLYILGRTLYMFSWEFIFRGYMLFGLEKSIGRSAIFVQTIPFVLLHFGCVFWETLACIPEGFLLGYIAYKTRSFLPCFVIHIGIDILMDVLTY